MNAVQIVLASRPDIVPALTDFRSQSVVLPELTPGEVLLKPLYISVDPSIRDRRNEEEVYIASFKVNDPITSSMVAEVEKSESEKFTPGDRVVGILPWATLQIATDSYLTKIGTTDIPVDYYLGVLGIPGLTAYFGLTEVCTPRPGETLIVSEAAGATGIIVGQIAKIMGSRVIGITDTDIKTEALLKEFGFDKTINYKTAENLQQVIAEACPQGVDCYFDNIGGYISDAVIANLNFNARVAISGQLALHNEINLSTSLRILPQILNQNALIQGFSVGSYQQRFTEALTQLMKWLREGKLKYKETIVNGFNRLPETYLDLYKGTNIGKMIVKTE